MSGEQRILGNHSVLKRNVVQNFGGGLTNGKN